MASVVFPGIAVIPAVRSVDYGGTDSAVIAGERYKKPRYTWIAAESRSSSRRKVARVCDDRHTLEKIEPACVEKNYVH